MLLYTLLYVCYARKSIYIILYYGQLCAPTWEGRAVDDKNEMLSGGLTILKPQKNVNTPKRLWSGAIFLFLPRCP